MMATMPPRKRKMRKVGDGPHEDTIFESHRRARDDRAASGAANGGGESVRLPGRRRLRTCAPLSVPLSRWRTPAELMLSLPAIYPAAGLSAAFSIAVVP